MQRGSSEAGAHSSAERSAAGRAVPRGFHAGDATGQDGGVTDASFEVPTPFQDLMHDNFCWGCGADNPDGLQLKSAWRADDPEVAVAHFTPSPAHAAGPRHVLNGGIIGVLLDCHGICTAVADAYRREGRAVGTEPELWYATSTTAHRVPAAHTDRRDRRARGPGRGRRRPRHYGRVCARRGRQARAARATVGAVRVPDSWRARLTESAARRLVLARGEQFLEIRTYRVEVRRGRSGAPRSGRPVPPRTTIAAAAAGSIPTALMPARRLRTIVSASASVRTPLSTMWSRMPSAISVRMRPGHTTDTPTPRPSNSTRSPFESPTTVCFAAA